MSVSVFDLFSIGIGPSSSHTVGPMRAAVRFLHVLQAQTAITRVKHVKVELYGSLALTGRGHGTDIAVLMGLEGEKPEVLDPATVTTRVQAIRDQKKLSLAGTHDIVFSEAEHLVFHRDKTLPFHSNGLRFTAYDEKDTVLLAAVYYSVGGGFVVDASQCDGNQQLGDLAAVTLPYPFRTAEALLNYCNQTSMSIAEIMWENERHWRSDKDITEGLNHIWTIMRECIERGCKRTGVLPGGLNVKRRAAALYQQLDAERDIRQTKKMQWLSLYAIAVNEENAAGGRVVTAPTNGAAGIIPAVLNYYQEFVETATEQGVLDFLLTAGAIGILYKEQASLSAAEVGCQGEVGVACSMAAAGLAAALGGDPSQIENAAEIGMEHHLGLTCDPIAGLVQIPCIERNAMGAVQAVNAAQLALLGDGEHHVSLDKVIATMRQTGMDMSTRYKETSQGGLAVNLPEC